MASATRILSTRVHEHKLLVPTVLSDARLMHRIRNRCGVQSQATPRRTSGGRAPVRVRVSRDCAHLAPAPAKRRNHLRKKSRPGPRMSAFRHHGTRRSPRPARLSSATGSWRAWPERRIARRARRSLYSVSVFLFVFRVCFCLLIPGQKRERAVTCLFHRSTPRPATARYRKIPRSTSHRPARSLQQVFQKPPTPKSARSRSRIGITSSSTGRSRVNEAPQPRKSTARPSSSIERRRQSSGPAYKVAPAALPLFGLWIISRVLTRSAGAEAVTYAAADTTVARVMAIAEPPGQLESNAVRERFA
jgi:hypothetical protein